MVHFRHRTRNRPRYVSFPFSAATRTDRTDRVLKCGAYGPTRKLKLPSVRWVSTDRTRQITL
jgi:hypothetical protein